MTKEQIRNSIRIIASCDKYNKLTDRLSDEIKGMGKLSKLNLRSLHREVYRKVMEDETVTSWHYEDDLPDGYPYDEMFLRSKVVDGVRMFPPVEPNPPEAPTPKQEPETMNSDLKAFARQTLKDGLAQCTEGQQAVFKQMYAGPTDPRQRTPKVIAQMRDANIDDVVDSMADDKLDWAMTQVEVTLAKAAKSEPKPAGNGIG